MLGDEYIVQDMDILDLDIRLLVIFEQLMQEQSATQVAKNLEISQPSVSYAIKRLRKIFQDHLFIPSKQGLIPTSKACYLYHGINEALTKLRDTVFTEWSFSHLSSERVFRIAMSDYFQQVFLPGFLRSINLTAPNISFDIISISENRTSSIYKKSHAQIQKGLLENKIDLVLDTTLESYDLFNYKKIISDGWCIIGPSYINSDLNNVHDGGIPCITVNGQHNRKHLKNHKSQIFMDSYASVGSIISMTGCVALVPRRIGRDMSRSFDTKILHDIDEESHLSGYQLWSNSTGATPDNKWLRMAVNSYCENI
jgi:DNA-binding transcriptional LysR family regulator